MSPVMVRGIYWQRGQRRAGNPRPSHARLEVEEGVYGETKATLAKATGSGVEVLGASSGSENVNGPHHILPADGALVHPLTTLGAGDHMATFQQHTVNGRVHTDLTQVLFCTCGNARV